MARTSFDSVPFANPGSAAAGTLRAKDRPYRCEMTFFGYGALPLPPQDGSTLPGRLRELPHSQIMELVAGLGVHTTGGTSVGMIAVATVQEVQARVEKITKLVEVEWNVGRTGIIAPRAVLEPVELDGSIVTYATLHNPADITRRGLMLDDHGCAEFAVMVQDFI